VLRVPEGLRENLSQTKAKLTGATMIYFTAAVAVFLIVYLFVAMIRPEWF
jgi:K+-transporting ATPase KdpF subunit